MTPAVTVVIPTFRRIAGLERAVTSVFAQSGCGNFELVIADNDPDAGAFSLASSLAARAPAHIRCRYLHVPAAGVANARNAALGAVTAPLVAFLDDDQSAPPAWLQSLLAGHARFPAAVTFGPVEAVLPRTDHQHAVYLQTFFSRRVPAPTGFTSASYGCGNSLLDLSRLPPQRPVFDLRTNETGGEDDLLFVRIREAQGQFAWCAEASVFEHVPGERASLSYTLKRAMAYGQGPITLARRQTPPDWPRVAGWMLIGAAKLTLHAALYLAGWLMRAPDRAHHLDQAARGFGKLIWWRSFRFYGAAQL